MIKKLLNLKLKFTKNQKGLTLIELLVVIVILGIIAAIAIPVVMGNQKDAHESTNQQNRSVLQDAVNRYKTLNNGTVPAIADLEEAETAAGAHNGGPFLDSIPELQGCTGEFTVNTTTGNVSFPTDCPGYKAPAEPGV